MAALSHSKALDSARTETLHEIIREAACKHRVLNGMATFIKAEMEELHGVPFRVVIDHDVPMVLIRPV